MEEKRKNKYIYFPIIGIVLVILNAIGLDTIGMSYYEEISDTNPLIFSILEEYDITGFTTAFLIMFIPHNLMLLALLKIFTLGTFKT